MAKPKVRDAWFDFSGGLNLDDNQEVLAKNEMLFMKNLRMVGNGLMKRGGSRRLNATALFGATTNVTGVYQWDGPDAGEAQVVAIAAGRLYYRNMSATEYGGAFTEVIPSPPFSTTGTQKFAQMRSTASSGDLRLYIADVDVIYEFNGSALTQLDTSGQLTIDATLLAPYHTRMFYADITDNAVNGTATPDPQRIYWSVISDPTDITIGGLSGGGNALVGYLHGEDITGIEVVGSSLFILTKDSVARFTGYSTEDIQLEQDSEGVVQNVGLVGRDAVTNVENILFFMDKTGPYAVTERGGASFVGKGIANIFSGAGVLLELNLWDQRINNATLDEDIFAYNEKAREIWWITRAGDDGGARKTVYAYSLRHQRWAGPWKFNFDILSVAKYDNGGNQTLIAGGTDGFIRVLDYDWGAGTTDDILSDGTGGTAFGFQLDLAPTYLGTVTQKAIDRAYITANEEVRLRISNDDGATWTSVDTASVSTLVQTRADIDIGGSRFRIRIDDPAGTANNRQIRISGLTLHGYDMQRPE